MDWQPGDEAVNTAFSSHPRCVVIATYRCWVWVHYPHAGSDAHALTLASNLKQMETADDEP